MFKNRKDAAEQLAENLKHLKNKNCIVLALPRGGVPLGAVIANALHAPLDVLLTKKIGHPLNKEYAIGSVTLHGTFTDHLVPDISPDYIRKETSLILKTLEEKHLLYTGNRRPAEISGKTVILVDDGAATGHTMLAALNMVRQLDADRVVIALPVCPADTAKKLAVASDDLVCLRVPLFFESVGQFYHDFSEVTDDEVVNLLQQSKQ